MQNCSEYSESRQVLKVLFIGNSATYVHELPETLCRLAQKAGYEITAESVVAGGATLSFHADNASEHGMHVLSAIRQGFDVVFLQDNGNCISCNEFRQASLNACEKLAQAARDASSRIALYVRPPYGYESWNLTPFEQCRAFDMHFGSLKDTLHPIYAHVNRAFAFAIRDTAFDLWGEDHAHTGDHGAYLAVCVFFATLFGTSSAVLDPNGLTPDDARTLQKIADQVALGGACPW